MPKILTLLIANNGVHCQKHRTKLRLHVSLGYVYLSLHPGFRAQGTSLFGVVPKVPRPANPEICHFGRSEKMESKHNEARYQWVRECVGTPNTH